MRRDYELPLLALQHAEAALVPALDHATYACLVRERLLARIFGGPELFAGLLHNAGRVHRDRVARRYNGTRTLLKDLEGGCNPGDTLPIASGGQRLATVALEAV